MNSFKTKVLICISLMAYVSGLFAQQWNGLTLYSNSNSTLGYLIDTNSTVVKTFTFNSGTGYSSHMIPGGTIFRTVQNNSNLINGGGVTGRMQKVDYNGNVLWDYVYSSSSYVIHHDHCPLPNGNVLVISYEVKTSADASAAGASNPIVVWSEKIMEWQPVGTNSVNVVWEWHLWDHLVQNVDQNKANYQTSIVDHPELMNINYNLQKDWVHMNGIDYNPLLDQIVFSSHNLNQWFVIDHSTTTMEAADHTGGKAGKGGDFLYRWGNTPSYQAGGSAILNVTHDAHWVKEGNSHEGYLAAINNRGVVSPTNKTTVDQVKPPRVGLNYTLAPGSAFAPSTYDYRHQSTGYTSNMGSVEEYPNGNQMVCLATAGLIYEINATGTTLWSKSTAGTTPQAHRYTQCYIDFTAPAQPSITLTNSVLSTASANSYQWYVNGTAINGATLQSYAPTQSGFYVVGVTDVNNCVKAYSALMSYTVADPNPVGINGFEKLSSIRIYPNPSTGIFKINGGDDLKEGYTVKVYNLSAQLIFEEKNSKTIDLSGYREGMYTLELVSSNGMVLCKKISLIK